MRIRFSGVFFTRKTTKVQGARAAGLQSADLDIDVATIVPMREAVKRLRDELKTLKGERANVAAEPVGDVTVTVGDVTTAVGNNMVLPSKATFEQVQRAEINKGAGQKPI